MAQHAGPTAGNLGLSAGSIWTGLTTAIDSDQDKPNKNGTASTCSNGQRRSNDTTDDDDDDDDDFDNEYKCIGNEPPCNLTSNISSERCLSINKLLEEQHHKWWSRYDKETSSTAEGPISPPSVDDNTPPELWQGRDGYNVSAFHQINGVWPLNHPLPLPDWAHDDHDHKCTLHFDSVWQYEDLSAIIETKLQRMLEETHYDTVHLFVAFYEAFKRTRRSDLKSFYQFYDIPINRRHHMCVSLAMEIMARIVEIFPILEQYLYIVSCEEQVVSLGEYIGKFTMAYFCLSSYLSFATLDSTSETNNCLYPL